MRRGFTLVELMIVTAAFAVVFLVATTVYTRAFRDQRATQSRQRNTSDNRYLIETITRAIRTGSIDYAFYETLDGNGVETISAPHHQLALRTSTGATTCFGFDGTSKLRTRSTCDATRADIPTTATDITPADVTITQLTILIRPGSNPFADRGATPVVCDRAATQEAINPVFPNPSCQANQWCCPDDLSTCQPEFDGSFLSGATPGICTLANLQPAVTLLLGSSVTSRGQTSSSTIQTTVVSRTYRR